MGWRPGTHCDRPHAARLGLILTRVSDTYLEFIRYKFRSLNDLDRFDQAARMTVTEGDFDFDLADGILVAKPRVDFHGIDEGLAAVEPILSAWAAQAALDQPGREIRFDYSDHRTIRRATGEPLATASSTETFNFGSAGAAITRDNLEYPAPPAGFRTDEVLEAILARTRHLDAGRAQVTDVANWVVTRIETAFGGTAKGSGVRTVVGQALAVDPRILNELARLASQNDPSIGRKAKGPEAPLTNAEKEWMRAAIIHIARQIGRSNAGARLTPKTMADLPAYP
jgi:hypothetical protein